MAPGPSEFAYQYSVALQNAGNEVVIATASGLVTRSDDNIPWKHIRAFSPDATMVVGRVQGKNFFLRKTATLRSNIKTLALALKYAKNERIDAIHVIDGELISLCLVNVRFGRPKNLFFTYRGYEMGAMGGNPVMLTYQLLRRVLWKLTAGNIHIDAETSQAAENLESTARLRNGTVHVIPHPIWSADEIEYITRSQARERLGIIHNNPIFLIFGHRPILQKAIDTVVVASPKLPMQVTFLIAGQETEVGTDLALERLIIENDSEHRFEWHNRYIPNELVESYFAASDALVLSYRREYIGASGVLSQAATYGLPVIASNSADLGSVVSSKQLGLTFETENPAALALAIDQFLKLPDTELAEYKTNLARLQSERSWQNIIAKHLDFYSVRLSRTNH